MIWQPGTSLSNGQCEIEAELSRRGGFGITYKVKNLAGATVVIKAPHEHRRSAPNYGDFVNCFVKEARNLEQVAQKQHPNIVKVRAFFYEKDFPCMVMDYVEGETLEDLVIRSGAIPEEILVRWIVTIAEALDRVHELGLIHRDANPANIIITTQNEPILIDFGIALNIQPRATTTIAAFAGHQTFAPIEQLEPDDEPGCMVLRNPQLDIYCLAATFYYAITGELPKGAFTRQMSVDRKGKDSLAEPRSLNPEISDRINHAILSGMQMDADDRPPSMKAWIKYLITDDELLSKIQPPTLESLPLQRLEFTTIEVNEKAEIIAKLTKSIQAFDELLNENLSLKMIIIPGGSFMMGSPENELRSYDDEKPQHLVTVPTFAIAQVLVTQAQWKAVAQLPKGKLKLNSEPSNFKGDNRPVERINWFEAVEFCDRLTKLTRRPYRLPSEAEWEYACRAGTTTPFNFGPTIATTISNYRGTNDVRENQTILGSYGEGPEGNYRGETTEVMKFSPNGNGLYDMHGNVWEWCQDHSHSDYENAPIDQLPWIESDADENSNRVLRGGSCSNPPQGCRSAIHSSNTPVFRSGSVGFRVICSLGN